MTKPRLGRRQGIQLVLALVVLGVAGQRFWRQYQGRAKTRGSRLAGERSGPPQDPSGPGRRPRSPQTHVIAVCRPGEGSAAERPGSPPHPSLRLSVELPTGNQGGLLSILAGDKVLALPSIPFKGQGLVYLESPLYMEKRRYVVKAASGKSWTAEVPCPPLLRDLRAVAARDCIALKWETLDTSAGKWTARPEIVVSRVDGEGGLLARKLANGSRIRPCFREVARIPATAREYRDRAVVAGETYVYRVAVEGKVEALLSRRDTGKVEAVTREIRGVAPVHNVLAGVVAIAESPKPLRVAVVSRSWQVADCQLATRMVRDALPALPWLLVTVRDAPQEVAAEKVVAGMGQDDRGVSAADLVPAEACLRVDVPETPGDEIHVWLEDYLNGRRLFVARVPLQCPRELVAQVVEKLPTWFPERAALNVGAEDKGEERPRLAVLAFQPMTRATSLQLSRGALRSLLAGELASSTRFELVDREWTDAAFGEQERLAIQGEAGMGELGRALGADYLLSGTYEIHGDGLALVVYLVDVAHGTTSGQVVCRGRVDEIGAMARQLEPRLRVPRPFAELNSAISLKVAFDIDLSLGGADYRDRVDVATLARSGDPEEVLLAADRLMRTDPEQARALVQRLARSDDRTDPQRLFAIASRLDALLRAAGKVDERVELWRQVTADIAEEKVRVELGVQVYLCEALCDAGETKEAAKWMRPGQGSIRHVLLYEALGLWQEAWQECRRERWLTKERPGPGYAAAVFLLQSASRQERQLVLAEIARRLSGLLPHQVNRALVELEQTGGLSDDLWGLSLCNAVLLGDGERRQAALANLPRMVPYQRVVSLSSAMRLAAERGQGELAQEMMTRILNLETADPRALKIKEIRRERGVPKARTPSVPVTVSRSQAKLLYERGHGARQRVGDMVYLLSPGEVLVAYNFRQEGILWQLDLEPLAPYFPDERRASPKCLQRFPSPGTEVQARADMVYTSVCLDGRLLAVDRANGRVKWSYTAWGRISPPVISPDGMRIAVADAIGAVEVLDAHTGTLLGHVPLLQLVGRVADGIGMELWAHSARSPDFEPTPSPWLSVKPSGVYLRPLWRSRNGGSRSSRGRAFDRYSLNIDTLACVLGSPPPSEPCEVLFAKLSDPTVPAKQRQARIAAAGHTFSMAVLLPALIEIAQKPGESRGVRDAALAVLARHDPSRAVLTMAEILNAPGNRTAHTACPPLMLEEAVAGRLDDEATQALLGLLDHPSLAIRKAAAYDLVCAVGRGASPYLKSLLAATSGTLDPHWKARMIEAMGKRRMVGALDLVLPVLQGLRERTGYPRERAELALLALARSGSQEALRHVMIPFDEEQHLALLRKAKSPIPRSGLRELEKPYRWIHDYLPMPRFAGFLRASLAVAPADVRPRILAAQVRVAGEEALPALMYQELSERVRRTNRLASLSLRDQSRRVLASLMGMDLGSEGAAWEQEMRRRPVRGRMTGGK